MLSIATARLHSPQVHTIQADLFQWQPTEQFDVVFFGFWLSHVPPERFAGFWQLVSRCLAPGGRVFSSIPVTTTRRQRLTTTFQNRMPLCCAAASTMGASFRS